MLPFLSFGILAPHLSRADENRPPAPSGYVWCDLEQLGGSTLMPRGWFCSEIAVPGGFGYRITKEEIPSKWVGRQNGFTIHDNNMSYLDRNRLTGADYQTGFTIKAVYGPFWDNSRLLKLSDGMIEDAKQQGHMLASVASTIGPYRTNTFDRETVITYRNTIESQHFVEEILQDTQKPTLIHVMFDCPLRDWPQNERYCKMFFATLSLFQSTEETNHTPYPPPSPAQTVEERPHDRP